MFKESVSEEWKVPGKLSGDDFGDIYDNEWGLAAMRWDGGDEKEQSDHDGDVE